MDFKMTDKLTDSEIVKALDEAELFLRNRLMDGQHLKLNEYDIGILRNISQVCAKAYDEINRLQAENERKDKIYIELLKTSSERAGIIGELQAENERLIGDVTTYKVRWAKATAKLDTAKAEAYKEFAERLSDRITDHLDQSLDNPNGNTYFITDVYTDIDNLLKELVGDTNE